MPGETGYARESRCAGEADQGAADQRRERSDGRIAVPSSSALLRRAMKRIAVAKKR
jgi:hypothetical protein